jgi:hypothetical protein
MRPASPASSERHSQTGPGPSGLFECCYCGVYKGKGGYCRLRVLISDHPSTPLVLLCVSPGGYTQEHQASAMADSLTRQLPFMLTEPERQLE